MSRKQVRERFRLISSLASTRIAPMKKCILVLIVSLLGYILVYIYMEMILHGTYKPSIEKSTNRKLILIWPKDLPGKYFGFPVGSWAFRHYKCSVSDCEVTTDRKRFSKADAIIFHPRDLQDHRSKDHKSVIPGYDMPHSHPPHQRWIFYFHESPMHTYLNLELFKNIFNWTMTYRLDSDIPMPFGLTVRKDCFDQNNCKEQKDNYAKNRTGLVAWFVSNCRTNSRRMEYVKKLQKYIDVDIFGDCTKKKCPKTVFFGAKSCYKMLNRYKFYLSFENSICQDYITEKAFGILSQTTAVPIVRGGGDYKNLPPHSYIDGNLFSPKELADHLKAINANDHWYNAFHKWRQHYFVLGNETETVALSHCDLCAKLHDQSLPVKWYGNMQNFWNKENDCMEKFDIPE